MNAVERVPVRYLDALAAEIRRHAEQAEADYMSAVAHAIRAGELLSEAKSQVGHGEWLPWLAEHFARTPQTAASYMRMADRRDEIENASSIRGALVQLKAPRAPRAPRAPNASEPDRCPRCERIVRGDRPHQCREAQRQLDEAHKALKAAADDIRAYPRASEVERGQCEDRVAACVLLAEQIGRTLSGAPERDERQLRLDRTLRVIEAKGFPVCDCGARLTELKGELVCFACGPERGEET